jgi:hypothetical protein
MIGQLCTCDVDNFGDLLYPIIFRRLAEKHGVAPAIVPLSFFPGPAPCAAGFDVRGINRVIKSRWRTLPHLVIGGGDVLRTDVATLANHYDSLFEKRARPQFWFRMKERRFGRQHLRNEFIRRFMGYSPIAPFILDPANHARVGAILYCSCGVPFRFPPSQFRAIRAAFEAAAFVYVRDSQSRDKLREAGVKWDIEVAPDLVVTLSDFFSKEEERLKGMALLASHGVDTAKPVICFQSCPQPPEQERELLQQLTALKGKLGAEIVLLPMGYCHGDDIFLQQLAARSSGSLTCINTHSIHAMISVIAVSKLFVGTSLHGNMSAFSFGIPHLFGPIAVDKVQGFLDIVGLGADFKLESWSQLADRQAVVMRFPPAHFITRAEAAKQAVHKTFRKMAKTLETPD